MALALPPALAAAEPPADERRPPLDLNAATADQLEALPGVGPGRARSIVRFREATGGFRCIAELLAVPQLPEKVYEAIRERVAVGGPFARPEACDPERPKPPKGES